VGFVKELNTMDRRLEKLEDLMTSINEHQANTALSLEEYKTNTADLKKDLEDSKVCLQTLKQRTTLPPATSSANRKKTQNRNQNLRGERPSASGTTRPARKPKKVLLMHDSQLNSFEADSFSSSFKVSKLKAGTYKDLVNKDIMRDAISQPEIECYILQLGVNDYRYDDSEATIKKAIDNAKTSIEKLLSASTAKIVVSLPTSTPGPLNDRTKQFVSGVTEFVTTKRSLSDYYRRLFTVNNTSHFSPALSAANSSEDCPNPLKSDQLHVSEYGMKKLCLNIKLGLYRAFGMKPPQKQASPEP
jgi:hypothetical protein